MRTPGDFTIDRLAARAPEAVETARAAVKGAPAVHGVVPRQTRLSIARALNDALAAKGIGPVTESMFFGWCVHVKRQQRAEVSGR